MRQLKQAGFTLIELLLYVAIVGSLLLAVVTFYGMTLDQRIKNQAIAEVNQQGTQVMDQMTQTIRNATSITTPTTAASGSTLILVVPTAASSPTTFALNGTALQITEGTGSAIALTGTRVKVGSVAFTNLTRSGTNGIIQISFVVSYANNTGRTTYDYQKTFTSSAEVRW
ncbi:MAG TPA: type II secretion system protein [Candidatus Saccharimonadales bacterium]|jgi:prepilin-type N-terminal cleavage/methylation domain-containing protein|nr:type II secretion system protein [Candidatus Saccharimonadales bacterium]